MLQIQVPPFTLQHPQSIINKSFSDTTSDNRGRVSADDMPPPAARVATAGGNASVPCVLLVQNAFHGGEQPRSSNPTLIQKKSVLGLCSSPFAPGRIAA